MTQFQPAGLYSQGGQMFVCRTKEQHDELTARGWKPIPLDHDEPYQPDKATWVENWHEIKSEDGDSAKAEKDSELEEQPAPKAAAPAKAKNGKK